MTTVRELITRWVFKGDTAAVERMGKGLHALKGVAKGAMLAVGGIATASAAAGHKLFSMTEKMAEHADMISKASARTGMGTEVLQQLKAAADKMEVSFGSLVKGMRTFTIGVNGATHGNKAARAAFAELGVQLKDNHGKLRTTDELVLDSLFSLSQMEDANKRNAVATKLFGRAGYELIPLLEEGGGAIAEMMAEAKRSGKVLDKLAVEAGDKLDKNLRALHGTIGYLKSQLGSALIPAVSEVVGEINAWVKANRGLVAQKLQEVAKSIAEALRDLMKAAKQGDLFGKLTALVKGLVEAMGFLLKHATAIKWTFFSLIGMNIGARLWPIAKALWGIGGSALAAGKGIAVLLGKFGGIITNGPLMLKAIAGLGRALGALGGLAASFGVGYAIGSWFDRMTGASDKLSDSLMGTERALSRLRAAQYAKQTFNKTLQEQAEMYAAMLRAGKTSVGIEGGRRMALTRENIQGRLAGVASKLGISKEEQASMLPALLEKAGVTQNNQISVEVKVPPGTDATQAKRTGDAAGAALVRAARQTLPSVVR